MNININNTERALETNGVAMRQTHQKKKKHRAGDSHTAAADGEAAALIRSDEGT